MKTKKIMTSLLISGLIMGSLATSQIALATNNDPIDYEPATFVEDAALDTRATLPARKPGIGVVGGDTGMMNLKVGSIIGFTVRYDDITMVGAESLSILKNGIIWMQFKPYAISPGSNSITYWYMFESRGSYIFEANRLVPGGANLTAKQRVVVR